MSATWLRHPEVSRKLRAKKLGGEAVHYDHPVTCSGKLEGWGVVDRLEARGAVRPSDLEATVSVGGSSRSPRQLEASPR